MGVRAILLGLFALPAVASIAFAGCGDDEATAPPDLDASSSETSSNDDGGGGADAGPPTEKSSCVTYIEAFCAKQEACSPSNRLALCKQTAELCPEYFFSEGSTRTIASMLACADEFAKMTCAEWNAGIRPSCQTPGTLPAGSSCISPAQCASANCDGLTLGTRCGTCSALYGADEECTNTGTFGPKVCPQNQRCDDVTKRCAPIVAPTMLTPGATCTANSTKELCPSGTDCYTTSPDAGTTTGTCQALPTAGNACVHTPGSGGGFCVAEAYCSFASGNTGTCLVNAKVGETCGYDAQSSTEIRCEPALYCKTDKCAAYEAVDAPCTRPDACGKTAYCDVNASTPVCRAAAAIGAACGIVRTDGGGSFYVPCAANGECKMDASGAGICEPPGSVGRGAACSPSMPCYSVLQCTNGTCTALDQAACIADAGDGG
jgi:hypothetical protein